MIPIAERLFLLDLEYLGQPGHIAAGLLETSDGLVLVDPGPVPTLPRLGSRQRPRGPGAASRFPAM